MPTFTKSCFPHPTPKTLFFWACFVISLSLVFSSFLFVFLQHKEGNNKQCRFRFENLIFNIPTILLREHQFGTPNINIPAAPKPVCSKLAWRGVSYCSKISVIFRRFLEVGSSLCAFLSPGGRVETLWGCDAAGAVHCLWRSLRAQRCMFWHFGWPGARSAPGFPKQETNRSDWIRLNQPDWAWREKTDLGGFERKENRVFAGFCVWGARESTKNKRNGFVGKAHYKFGFALRKPLPSRYFEVGRLTNSGGLGIGGIKAHEVVAWLDIDKLGMGVHSRASWDGGCPAS